MLFSTYCYHTVSMTNSFFINCSSVEMIIFQKWLRYIHISLTDIYTEHRTETYHVCSIHIILYYHINFKMQCIWLKHAVGRWYLLIKQLSNYTYNLNYSGVTTYVKEHIIGLFQKTTTNIRGWDIVTTAQSSTAERLKPSALCDVANYESLSLYRREWPNTVSWITLTNWRIPARVCHPVRHK